MAIARSSIGKTLTPTGVIVPFAGSSVPSHWLLCDGSPVSRTTYAALFNVISTTYGTGDGSSTFNLPDLRGRVPVGLDNIGGSDAGRLSAANTLGLTGGAETHTLTSSELASHTHSVTDPGHSHTPQNGGGPVYDTHALNGSTNLVNGNATNSSSTGISIQNAGSDGAHQNTQPSMILNYIIST